MDSLIQLKCSCHSVRAFLQSCSCHSPSPYAYSTSEVICCPYLVEIPPDFPIPLRFHESRTFHQAMKCHPDLQNLRTEAILSCLSTYCVFSSGGMEGSGPPDWSPLGPRLPSLFFRLMIRSSPLYLIPLPSFVPFPTSNLFLDFEFAVAYQFPFLSSARNSLHVFCLSR